MNFWDFIWFLIWSYVFIAYLMLLFAIIGDIFRDRELNGWLKAIWMICLVFIPFLTAIVYLITRGSMMTERRYAAAQEARSETDSYIRSVASSSAADEIAKAKALLEAGTISQAEFDTLKARAMSGSQQSGSQQPASV
jgi:hypothetical protein